MGYAAEVICGTWTGAWVGVEGDAERVHRGSWTAGREGSGYGDVATDCGKQGQGYLTGDFENLLCAECARLNEGERPR